MPPDQARDVRDKIGQRIERGDLVVYPKSSRAEMYLGMVLGTSRGKVNTKEEMMVLFILRFDVARDNGLPEVRRVLARVKPGSVLVLPKGVLLDRVAQIEDLGLRSLAEEMEGRRA